MRQGNTEPAASVIEDAPEFALEAHKGQVDKGGRPGIFHPLRLMLSMETDEQRLAARPAAVIGLAPMQSLVFPGNGRGK